jgi:glycosyltransferase involved in cell wall biosynthesis
MKIAIISSGFLPVIDGVTVTLQNRLKKLSQQGHQVLLLCPDYSPIESAYPNWRNYVGSILPGVNVVPLASTPFMDLDFERNVSRKSYQNLLQELERFQPDVIHVDEPDRLFLGFFKNPGVDFSKRSRIPCVGFFHTNFIEYIDDYFSLPAFIIAIIKFFSKLSISRTYNSYDATLTASSTTRDKLVKMGIKNVINGEFLGVDLNKFHPDLRDRQFFERTYGLSNVDQKVKLVFLGRLTPDKGWNFAIDALLKLVQEMDLEHVVIIVAGDGPMRDQIADKLGNLPFKLCLLGRVLPEDVPALLANSDIHVTASEKETKGLTLLEAFASGIPVIAPRAGGVIDTVQDNWNGYLFHPGDKRDFAKKLRQLINEPTLRQEMGTRGRDSVAQQDWDNAVDHLVRVWQEQIDRKKYQR